MDQTEKHTFLLLTCTVAPVGTRCNVAVSVRFFTFVFNKYKIKNVLTGIWRNHQQNKVTKCPALTQLLSDCCSVLTNQLTGTTWPITHLLLVPLTWMHFFFFLMISICSVKVFVAAVLLLAHEQNSSHSLKWSFFIEQNLPSRKFYFLSADKLPLISVVASKSNSLWWYCDIVKGSDFRRVVRCTSSNRQWRM